MNALFLALAGAAGLLIGGGVNDSSDLELQATIKAPCYTS